MPLTLLHNCIFRFCSVLNIHFNGVYLSFCCFIKWQLPEWFYFELLLIFWPLPGNFLVVCCTHSSSLISQAYILSSFVLETVLIQVFISFHFMENISIFSIGVLCKMYLLFFLLVSGRRGGTDEFPLLFRQSRWNFD